MQRMQVIDTHTGGEPTRIVLAGGPDLGTGDLAVRRARFQADFDRYRAAIVNEPRGSDVMVGALVCEPSDPSCTAGVIFFNNVGYLGMCGHGTIGLMVALGWTGRLSAGTHRLETPVGSITVDYDGANTVSLENVPSERLAANVPVDVPGLGTVHGDIAWGGNWFYLVGEECVDALGLTLSRECVEELTAVTRQIRDALEAAGITGRGGQAIDHIELFGPPSDPANHSRNFVLCPGGAYDRSPCGTGTSAKLACLAAAEKLQPGEIWRQESIIGSLFAGSYRQQGELIIPRIRGTAYVTGETTLILDPADPLVWGIGR